MSNENQQIGAIKAKKSFQNEKLSETNFPGQPTGRMISVYFFLINITSHKVDKKEKWYATMNP